MAFHPAERRNRRSEAAKSAQVCVVFELSESRRDELVESWAQRVVARGLGTAAVFLLEAHKPLGGLGAQAVVAFQPLLTPLVPLNVGEVAAFMRQADNVERLVLRIEQLEHERNEHLARQRRRAAEVRRRARRIRKLRRRQAQQSDPEQ